MAVELLSSAYVRLFVTASVRGSVFEKRLDDICSEIREGKGSKEVLSKELGMLVRQHCPKLVWNHLRIDDRAIQKYVLIELNRTLSKSKTWAPPPPGTLEVEHVLPQTRKKGDYPKISDIDYEFYVNHIGNLTLILEEDNPRCGNYSFDKKKQIYAEYDGRNVEVDLEGYPEIVTKDLVLTELLVQYDGWGISQIEARAEFLAGLAEKKWPAPKLPE